MKVKLLKKFRKQYRILRYEKYYYDRKLGKGDVVFELMTKKHVLVLDCAINKSGLMHRISFNQFNDEETCINFLKKYAFKDFLKNNSYQKHKITFIWP